MGLFGPSWNWEEIQKKDALMGELKRENDRILNEQRKMIKKNIDNMEFSNSSSDSGGSMLFGLAVLCIPLAFVMINFLLGTVQLGVKEDALSMEVTIMVAGSIISWVIALIVSLTTKEKKLLKTAGIIFIVSELINYLGVLVYDIAYNNAFGDFFRILQFIIAAVLTIITSLLWSIVSTIIGTILVSLLSFSITTIYKYIKLNIKKKRISNSALYKDIIKLINETDIYYITISEFDIEIVSGNTTIINYESKGYSNLDEIGKKALGYILKKNLTKFKIKVENGLVVLKNIDYEKNKRNAIKSQEKHDKVQNKLNKIKQKEKIKNGNDW